MKSGQHILINGASGSLGTAAVQLAKNMNVRVTAVCSSSNFDMVKDLGADELIDYKTQDFTKNNQASILFYDHRSLASSRPSGGNHSSKAANLSN